MLCMLWLKEVNVHTGYYLYKYMEKLSGIKNKRKKKKTLRDPWTNKAAKANLNNIVYIWPAVCIIQLIND